MSEKELIKSYPEFRINHLIKQKKFSEILNKEYRKKTKF